MGNHALSLNRKSSVRDLFKLAKRLSSTLSFEDVTENAAAPTFITESQYLSVASECIDVFAAAADDPEATEAFIKTVLVSSLPLTVDVIRRHLSLPPTVTDSGSGFIKIGRITLPTKLATSGIRESGPAMEDPASTAANFVSTDYSLKLMQTVSSSIKQNEPTLLVGETGCGKTTIVQQLAALTRKNLIVQNLSLQTDSTDLLGGYRPLEIKHLARPMYDSFFSLFVSHFSRKQNEQFLTFVKNALERKQYKKLSQCFLKASKMGLDKFQHGSGASAPSNKKSTHNYNAFIEWETFSASAKKFERQRVASTSGLAFTFTEGVLVKAIRNGDWVLLDEINLASSETLQRLFGLLDGSSGTVTVTERGDTAAVLRHPEFRLFAAMNPATDSGKKDLPSSMRARFSEIYVSELTDARELREISSNFLSGHIQGGNSESQEVGINAPYIICIYAYLFCVHFCALPTYLATTFRA